MATTPQITTLRNAIVDQLTDKMTGGTSPYHFSDTAVKEGKPTSEDLKTNKHGIWIWRDSLTTDDRTIPTLRHFKRATFRIFGYTETIDVRDEIEKLEHDVEQAIWSAPGFGCSATIALLETVEYEDQEINLGDGIVRGSSFTLELTVTFHETFTSS